MRGAARRGRDGHRAAACWLLAVVAALGAGCPRLSASAHENRAPVAAVAADHLEVHPGDDVTLDGSPSSDPDGDALAFRWTERPGADAVALGGAAAPKATFTAPATPGHLVFSLVVNDGLADSAPVDVDVHVTTAPIAHIAGDAATLPGAPVILTGSADAEKGATLSFAWAVAAGPACVDDPAPCFDRTDAETVSFTPPAKGAYDVTLVVTAAPPGADPGAAEASAPAHLGVTAGNRAPTASFAVNGVTTPGGSGATLTSTSTDPDGDPLTFAWSVVTEPAGGGAVLADPAASSTTLQAFRAGSYLVSLTVTDADGAQASATASVDVADNAPNVAVTGSPAAVVPGTPVALDALADDTDGDPLTFSWTVLHAPAADAAPALTGADTAALTLTPSTKTEVQDPALCAANPNGCYALRVAVSDGVRTATADAFVVALDRAPVVTAPSPLSGVTGAANPLSVSALDADGDALTFSWSVVDAPVAGAACVVDGAPGPCLAAAATATPVFTPPGLADGTYTLRVDVSDGTASSPADVVVVVAAEPPAENRAPVASIAAASTTVVSGGAVDLDGSASSDPDGDAIAAFSWSVVSAPANGVALFSPAAADVAAPALTLRGRGAYTVSLVVTDARGLASAPALLSLAATNAPPVADAGADVAVPDRTALALSGSAADLDGDAISFRWSVVDAPGGALASGLLTNAGAADAVFTPTLRTAVDDPTLCTPGACYVLQLDAFDGFAHGTDTVVVTSTNRAPVADAGPDQGSAGELVALDGTASSDPDGDALTSFTWTQVEGPDVTGGAGTLTGAIPSFQAAATGTYAFSLVVSDGTAQSAPDTVVVVVPHVDRAPVVSVANPDVTAPAGSAFPLHADVLDADADPTNVAWTKTAGDALFPDSFAGTDPVVTAPSLRALLASTGGDNGASYDVVATDPSGKSSAPVSVRLFVLPGDEHIVLSPAGADTGTCGTLASPCATFSFASSAASIQGKDLVAVSGAYAETAPSSGVSWPGGVSLFAGRDPTTFAKAAPSTLACSGTTDPDTACLLFAAGVGDDVLVQNLAVVADPGATSSTVGVRCDGCAARFEDLSSSAAGAPQSVALLVEAGAGPTSGTPLFARLALDVSDACTLVGFDVGADADPSASDVDVTVTAARAGCASTSFAALQVRGGAAELVRANAQVSAAAASGTSTGAGVVVDAAGSATVSDSLLVVDAGDGASVVDGDLVLEHDVLAASAATGAGLRFAAQPQAPAALVERTAITGFSSGVDLADNGAGASLPTSFVALPATCDGLTAASAADLDPAGAFATGCAAAGLVDALSRTCAFTPAFALVDEACLQ